MRNHKVDLAFIQMLVTIIYNASDTHEIITKNFPTRKYVMTMSLEMFMEIPRVLNMVVSLK